MEYIVRILSDFPSSYYFIAAEIVTKNRPKGLDFNTLERNKKEAEVIRVL